MGNGVFLIDADAHAEAKKTGDYTPDGSGEKKVDETKPDGAANAAGEPEKSIIPDTDPGDDTEPNKAEGDDAEGTQDKKEDEADPSAEFNQQFEGWANEFIENGALSEESRNAVVEKVFAENVPAEFKAQFIETYEAGLAAIRAATTQQVFGLVGGADQYNAMLTWGNENLPEAEREAWDADVLGNDSVKRDTAIKGLYARFQQAKGSQSDFEPDLSHDGGRTQGEPIIGSRQELVRIMRTPEYDKDPAVREKVARQLKQSMATGKYVSD